ncbi:hypothetical protein [Parvularcula dongshanensis]|uniref:Glycosyltransferase family 2 protein n=1 Tax=Parvularcula dongshanensis TaxID=1173995 RepID=A0A840I237_9PROT|nr:hypothetical protein [Parvularcula dongshanensis]MBB4659076.1 hypothetical protein [Parvularcula dongshanensis]
MLDSLRTALRLAKREPDIGRVTTFTDEDLVFFMPVYEDAQVAFRALTRLRRYYPGSRLVVLSDGDDTFPGEAVQRRFGAEYVLGENLYGIEHGGRMVHRILEHYMRAPARYLVRLDSDARIDRRFSWLPEADGLYGKVGERSGTVQGGALLLTHGAAAKLYDERTLLSDKLLDPARSWGRYSTKANLDRKLGLGTVAYDKVIHWACVEAGVPTRGFSEIYSVWKAAPDDLEIANADERYAVVHPDKMTSDEVAA